MHQHSSGERVCGTVMLLWSVRAPYPSSVTYITAINLDECRTQPYIRLSDKAILQIYYSVRKRQSNSPGIHSLVVGGVNVANSHLLACLVFIN